MTTLPQDVEADLRHRILELERRLDQATVQRDEAIERATATALVNFRLQNELRASLERQNAGAEILRTIASAPTDAERSLQRIAETAARFFNASSVTIRITDGKEWVRTIRVGGGSERIVAAVPESELAIDGKNVAALVYRENRQIHVPDLDHVDASIADFPGFAPARAGGSRTVSGTPLRRGAGAIGAMIIHRDRLAPFTPDELALQQSFADQAVIAIENARLFNETQEALERQTATADILRVIASSPSDVQPVFDAIAERSNRLLGGLSTAVYSLIGSEQHLMAFTPTSPAADATLKAMFPRPLSEVFWSDAILKGEVFRIVDAEVEFDTLPSMRELARLRGWRSALLVPLLRDQKSIGLISVTRTEPGPFADHHVQLLQTFADQAVIAIENVRLFNETREALERQTATSDILKVIASSPSDVQPVFDVIVERAVRLCGARMGRVYRYDGSLIHMVGGHGLSEPGRDSAQRPFPRPASEDTIVGRVMLSRRANVLADLDEDDTVPELSREMISSIGARSQVTMPMLLKGEPIGAITLSWTEPRGYNDQQIALLQTFADQAVIAIENVRLFNETREALERQTATSDILKVIASSPSDVQPVFDAIAESARRVVGGYSSVVTRVVGDDLHLAAFTTGSEVGKVSLARLFPQSLSSPLTHARIARTARIVVYADTESDVDDTSKETARARGYRSLLGVPMLRDGVAIGTIAVSRAEPGGFDDNTIGLLKTFADQAVIAIENVRLFNETREALERQTATADILKVIASSPSDTQPVFDAIAASAKRLLGGFSSTVTLLIDGVSYLKALTPTTPEGDEVLKSTFPRPIANFPPARMAQLGEITQVADTEAAPDELRDLARARGYRSVVFAPLMNKGVMIGLLGVTRLQPGLFADHHVQLLQTFADQAVIAIENARLFNETQEALERQTATADILKVIASSPSDVQPVFDAIAERSNRLVDGLSTSVLSLVDDALHMVAYTKVSPAADAALRAYYPQPLSTFAWGETVRRGEIVRIPDSEDEAATPAAVREVARARGWRSAMLVPLLRDRKPIGMISVTRRETGPFADHHVQLLQTFADQAVIAIENTRLFNETQEALERQTATADILKVIASSPSDVQPVFDAIAESANRLLGGFSSTVSLFIDGIAHLKAFTPTTPEADQVLTSNFPRPVADVTPFHLTEAGEVVQIPDTEAPTYQLRDVARARGYRSMLFAPLMNKGTSIGFIAVTRVQPGGFIDHHVQLLQTFADQAVIAIENARLFNEVQARTRDLEESLQQQTATADVLKVISRSAFDLQIVLDTLVESAARLCEADMTVITRQKGSKYFRAGSYGFSPEFLDYMKDVPVKPERATIAGRTLLEGTVVHVHDVHADPDYAFPEAQRLSGDPRTMLGVPLLREGKTVGALVLLRRNVQPFTDKQIELVTTFADQAVIAIENVKLFDEVQAKTRDLEEALEQQIATSEVLSVISSSAGELAPVFDAMLGKAMQLCGAHFGILNTFDGAQFLTAATHGLPPAYDEFRRGRPLDYGPHTAPARLLEGEPFVEIVDLVDSEAYRAGEANRRALVDLGGARSLLAVPLLRDERVVGNVMIFRQEQRPFSEKQITLLQQFAAQAVIAIENARLLGELRESLQQQTATSEVLQVISSSPGDLAPVFDKMLENATRVCGAEFGSMNLVEGDTLRQAALYNAPQALAEARANKVFHTHPQSAIAIAIRSKQVVHVDDLRDNLAYREGAQATVELVDLGGARTVVSVPMLRDDEVIGVITAFRQEVRPFGDKQIDLLGNFARQAVIAIENARLLGELRQRTADLSESLQQQTATSEVLQIISSSPSDLAPVFEKMLENAVRICGAEFGSMLLNDKDGLVHQAARYNMPPAFAAARAHRAFRPTPKSLLAQAIEAKRVVHVADVRTTPAYLERAQPTVELVELGGARTIVVVPMLRDNEVIGTITVYRQEVRLFDDKQIELVSNFAKQAVIAIENARLLRELRQRTDDLSEALTYQTGSSNILKVIASSPTDVGPALKAIVESACEICDAYDAVVFLRDGDDLVFSAHHGPIPFELERWPINRKWVTGRAAVDKVPQHIQDLNGPEGEDFPEGRELAHHQGHRTVLSVPLLREGEAIGVISLRRIEVHPFNDKQIELLKSFADQAVIAISNVRLFEAVQDRTRQLSKSLDDLRTAQDRLIQTEKLASLGQLTAGIAHEIKNPLNFVNNFAALSAELTDELKDHLNSTMLADATRKEVDELTGLLKDNLQKVVQHGKRADSIVKNMLLHSREGSGEHRPADVNALVDESLNLAYHGARAEKPQFNVTLERDFDPAAGSADVFPQEITRVLLNLISNGFYAVSKRKADNGGADFEPTVRATTLARGDHVEIRIRDNGTGIPEHVKEKMFNPFFTTKPAGEGTGLGLSMSHDIIVKQHGGAIEVDTEPGAFTEFRVVLPRASIQGKASSG
jgi:GAF domain-containing protein